MGKPRRRLQKRRPDTARHVGMGKEPYEISYDDDVSKSWEEVKKNRGERRHKGSFFRSIFDRGETGQVKRTRSPPMMSGAIAGSDSSLSVTTLGEHPQERRRERDHNASLRSQDRIRNMDASSEVPSIPDSDSLLTGKEQTSRNKRNFTGSPLHRIIVDDADRSIADVNSILDTDEIFPNSRKFDRLPEQFKHNQRLNDSASGLQRKNSDYLTLPSFSETRPVVGRTAAVATEDDDWASQQSSDTSVKSILKKGGKDENFETRSTNSRKFVSFNDGVVSSRDRDDKKGRKGLLRDVIDPDSTKRRERLRKHQVEPSERGEHLNHSDRTKPSFSIDRENLESTRASQRPPAHGNDSLGYDYEYGNGNPQHNVEYGTIRSAAIPLPPVTRYVETLCDNCNDWIYVDPDTREPVDDLPLPQEFCCHCGQPWPAGKPFTEGMVKSIRERLNQSKVREEELMVKAALCAKCRRKDPDEGLEDISLRNIGRNKAARIDHYCEPVDFERGKEKMGSLRSRINRVKKLGNKKALLIGMNYSGQKGELRGCRKDVRNMYWFLKENGYKDDDIEILLDKEPFLSPERMVILESLSQLIGDAQPGDTLFLHFSGHGHQIDDLSGDEIDGMDECIFPVDHQTEGKIVDDLLHKIIIKLPKGAQLTALFDSCHSGSVLDLPYEFKGGSFRRVDLHHRYTLEEDDALENCGNIILWSGCKDKQTSAEAKKNGTVVGAMSKAFIDANRLLQRKKKKKLSSLRRNKDYTYSELLDEIRARLTERSQDAQLSSSWDFVPGKQSYKV